MNQYGDVGYIKSCGINNIVLLCCLGLSHTGFLFVLMNVMLCSRAVVPWYVTIPSQDSARQHSLSFPEDQKIAFKTGINNRGRFLGLMLTLRAVVCMACTYCELCVTLSELLLDSDICSSSGGISSSQYSLHSDACACHRKTKTHLG
jgi:hypothetical protein